MKDIRERIAELGEDSGRRREAATTTEWMQKIAHGRWG